MSTSHEKAGAGCVPTPAKENDTLNELPDPSLRNSAIVRFDALPQGLRDRPQWCLAGKGKEPLTLDGRLASVTDPRTWGDFARVANVAVQKGLCIGFVLSESDPFACIDLDVVDADTQLAKGQPIDSSKWTTPDQLARYGKIVRAFDSYTELSRSGKGCHVWVKGNVVQGGRRDGVEVYSQARFMICTGNPIQGYNKPIEHRQELLEKLIAEIRAEQATATVELVEVAETEADEVIWERAANAENGDKFQQLWKGGWEALGYPSQSEADLSLLSMLAFYSKSNEQARRLFRMSDLGKREKAMKNDKYIDRTLSMIRGRQESESACLESAAALSAELMKNLLANSATQGGQLGNPLDPQPQPAPAPRSAAQLPWPPGVAGQVAQLIYGAAMRPVLEVAIVAALGLLAGVCGARWVIPKSGLNLYLVLLAKSGIGKEAMSEGITMFVNGVKGRHPDVDLFFDFAEYASGPALIKTAIDRTSFLQVSNEFGRRLKRMSEANDGALQSLRTAMTKLYSKSGPQATVGGIAYSDQEKSVGSVGGIAFSMIGDSTPGTFREAITADMMEDGFMSRFTVIEHEGDRPPENPNPHLHLPEGWANWFADLVAQALALDRNNNYQHVFRNPSAAEILHAFDLECDASINRAGEDESRRQMWNRAHLKALRIAGLLAVADNYLNPVIATAHAEWAIDLVRRDIAVFTSRLQSGDIGSDDRSRETKVLAILKEYLIEVPKPSYKVKPALHQSRIIPRKYLTVRTASLPAFKDHKLGSTGALEQVLRSLVSNGYVTKCAGPEMVKSYNEHGECYLVIDLPH
ncbi:DUF3987 domain-containing protein [Azonexus sp. IMCC34842]|uniref:phage NrS-1 polymerase family protein n=1 Tax=Azonexus sp. IMCC34842 TaxID=3420950 RepID=UPI003D13979B